jgi:SAM-dependent methyltransferase
MSDAWNHNIHYHDVVLRSVPPNCRRALDVGCGEGHLARQLASYCRQVIALDLDRAVLERARATTAENRRVAFVQGDAMAPPLRDESFDLISSVATLHHLPLRPALERLRDLLRSGGVLAIVGLYRMYGFPDYALAAAAVPASWIYRIVRHFAEVRAPIQEPKESLDEIRAACEELLPGAVFRRHLLFRYSLIWRKP